MKKILNLIVTVLVLSVMTMPSLSNTANAAEEQKEEQGTFQLENINESVLEIKLQDAEFYFDKDGNPMIKDKKSNTEKALPTTGSDKDDNPVSLEYKKTENGFLVEALTDNTGLVQTMSVGKCITGTAGGAITGGGTLGLAGTAAGTVTIPGIGTVGGGVIGAIAGAVGGGLTGASTSCFK
ncbi:Pathogenicity island protein [Priestia aryabhattai]|uniref:Pathogenicity island protein n=1 Tax=Thalassospira mesophila TaxID=1293891 RepID=A0A1Y2KX54_9PROT|nr:MULTISPECIES: hypothetical protein [Bacteria]MED4008917.1 Pathogenicity island protein [Priestia aryabhattai]OSQ34778.1 Pathogenicity island protein [Thalassospira mesophila]